MQNPLDWLPAPIPGPGSVDAKRACQLGSRDADKIGIFPEPGFSNARCPQGVR